MTAEFHILLFLFRSTLSILSIWVLQLHLICISEILSIVTLKQ